MLQAELARNLADLFEELGLEGGVEGQEGRIGIDGLDDEVTGRAGLLGTDEADAPDRREDLVFEWGEEGVGILGPRALSTPSTWG